MLALLLVDFEELVNFRELRKIELLLVLGKVTLERLDSGFRAGHIAQDRDPVIDLGLLDLDGSLKLLRLPHHIVGRHFAEVAREHGVASPIVERLGGDGGLHQVRRDNRRWGGVEHLEFVREKVEVGTTGFRT
jgi:hypothetical protein